MHRTNWKMGVTHIHALLMSVCSCIYIPTHTPVSMYWERETIKASICDGRAIHTNETVANFRFDMIRCRRLYCRRCCCWLVKQVRHTTPRKIVCRKSKMAAEFDFWSKFGTAAQVLLHRDLKWYEEQRYLYLPTASVQYNIWLMLFFRNLSKDWLFSFYILSKFIQSFRLLCMAEQTSSHQANNLDMYQNITIDLVYSLWQFSQPLSLSYTRNLYEQHKSTMWRERSIVLICLSVYIFLSVVFLRSEEEDPLPTLPLPSLHLRISRLSTNEQNEHKKAALKLASLNADEQIRGKRFPTAAGMTA